MIEELICFGLTRQEATIYLTLLTDGAITGYEAAKLTGISRSNTYNALAGLVEKGAAYIIEGTVTKYYAVQVEEFCNNKLKALDRMKEQLIKKVPSRKEETGGYITIGGERHILDKMRNMLLKSEHRVYISVSDEILDLLFDELNELGMRNIKLVIIGSKQYISSAKSKELKDAIFYESNKVTNQIRLIVDSVRVLTGDISKEEKSTCLYSENKNLVDVFKQMMRNEIELIDIHRKCK